jgi:tetratricopeptide (TPR) repeat protein
MQSPAKCGRTGFFFPMRAVAVAGMLLMLAGCERFFQDHSKSALDSGDKKYAEGDYQGAVQYYEDALDGTPATAEIHYKLALLFDDKLKNPLAAMYHFQRYIDLKPSGSHAKEAGGFMKEDEMKLVTTFSHGALMSQEDAVRLKNDNLALRKQLTELRAAPKAPPSNPGNAESTGAQDPVPSGARTYEVQVGDTLASISRKFYKNSARWKDIQTANNNKLKGTVKLKPGMTLVIPK